MNDLIALLQDKKINRTECEKLSLASLILVEGIIRGLNNTKAIPASRLQKALNFEDYIRKPWGKIGFDALRSNIMKMSARTWKKKVYDVEGFGWAINFWALCSILHLGTRFGKERSTTTSEDPLLLRWDSTEIPRADRISEVENIDNVSVFNFFKKKFYKQLIKYMHFYVFCFKMFTDYGQNNSRRPGKAQESCSTNRL